MWEEVQLDVEPEDSPSTPLGLEAVQVRQVQGLLHAVRPSQAAPPTPQQRTALHLLRMWKVLHFSFRSANALEDRPDLQAQRRRSGDQRREGGG